MRLIEIQASTSTMSAKIPKQFLHYPSAKETITYFAPQIPVLGTPQNQGYHFGGPYNKDDDILGSKASHIS